MESERKELVVLSAAGLERVELIDSGRTVAVRLRAACGKEIALLLPRRVASEVERGLAGTNRSEGNGSG